MPTMDFSNTSLPGVKLVRLPRFEDDRGDFLKIFNDVYYSENGCRFECRETYLTTSRRGVLRGMHFQVPPNDYVKIACVISGRILDVLLDLRRSSPTFGKYYSVELDASEPSCLFIPSGVAHGFLALQDQSRVLYLQSAVHAPDSDRGVRWDSFGFPWPVEAGESILSQRDRTHPPLRDFKSPFA